jgi:hypothetical protein
MHSTLDTSRARKSRIEMQEPLYRRKYLKKLQNRKPKEIILLSQAT